MESVNTQSKIEKYLTIYKSSRNIDRITSAAAKLIMFALTKFYNGEYEEFKEWYIVNLIDDTAIGVLTGGRLGCGSIIIGRFTGKYWTITYNRSLLMLNNYYYQRIYRKVYREWFTTDDRRAWGILIGFKKSIWLGNYNINKDKKSNDKRGDDRC